MPRLVGSVTSSSRAESRTISHSCAEGLQDDVGEVVFQLSYGVLKSPHRMTLFDDDTLFRDIASSVRLSVEVGGRYNTPKRIDLFRSEMSIHAIQYCQLLDHVVWWLVSCFER